MGEWEYQKLDLNDARPRQDDVDMLNSAGREGWELVAVTPSGVAYLKHEVQTEKPRRRKVSASDAPG